MSKNGVRDTFIVEFSGAQLRAAQAAMAAVLSNQGLYETVYPGLVNKKTALAASKALRAAIQPVDIPVERKPRGSKGRFSTQRK
jgi:hypothetical protein